MKAAATKLVRLLICTVFTCPHDYILGQLAVIALQTRHFNIC